MEINSIFAYMHRSTPLKRILHYGSSLSFFSVVGISFNKTPTSGKRKFECMMLKGLFMILVYLNKLTWISDRNFIE